MKENFYNLHYIGKIIITTYDSFEKFLHAKVNLKKDREETEKKLSDDYGDVVKL